MIFLEVVGFIGCSSPPTWSVRSPSALVVQAFYGVDVREHGSGNVGTTNVFRVLGKKAGIAVLLCDMLKGYVPAVIAAHLLNPWLAIFVAGAPVAGHMYSVFLKGSGGKGVATGAAVVLALVPLAFAIILVVWITLILVTRYVSLASLVAAFLVPVLTLLLVIRCRTRSPAYWSPSSSGGRIAATSVGCWKAPRAA